MEQGKEKRTITLPRNIKVLVLQLREDGEELVEEACYLGGELVVVPTFSPVKLAKQRDGGERRGKRDGGRGGERDVRDIRHTLREARAHWLLDP